MHRFWLIAFALIGLLGPGVSFVTLNAGVAEPKRVLLLHSFGRDFGTWAVFAKDFRAELDRRSPQTVEFFDVALMTERFGAGQNEGPFVDYLQSLFAKRPLDLITVIGGPAARFVQQHRSQLFPSTPVLFAAVDQRRVSLTPPTANDAVVAVSIDFVTVVKNILAVLPETTGITVVIGKSPIEQYWLEQIRSAVQPYTNQIGFTWLNDLSVDEMQKRVATLPPKSAIFYWGVSLDAAGHSYEGGKALASLRAVANAPIFTSVDTNFGDGVVGGSLISVKDAAQQTAGVAMRILNGEAPGGIETPPIGHGTPKYDWRELSRWNIGESQVPPGSDIRFRKLTAWEEYWWEVNAAFAAVLLQSAMIGWLLIERRRRHLAELESRARLREVIHLDRVAAAGEMSASIAHEVNQPLAAIVSSANAGLRWLAHVPPNVEEISTSLKRIAGDGHRASQVIATIRAMFRKDGGQKALVDVDELIREVLTLLHVELKENDVIVTTESADGILRMLADRTQLLQVILNLIRNSIDAMSSVSDRARVLQVRSEASNSGEVIVTIEDSGTGIDPANLDRIFQPFFTTKSTGMGMGLSICRSIIEDHGGRLSAASAKSYGSTFKIVLPMPNQGTAA